MTDNQKKERFGDIWFRARHNALANQVAASKIKKLLILVDVLIALFVVMPFASTACAELELIDSLTASLFSAVGTFSALYLSLVGFIRELRSDFESHNRAHAMFNNISQKARRGENELGDDEVKYLLRSLEEMFETAKYHYAEPSDGCYNGGLKRMTNMPKWPFDIPIVKYRKAALWAKVVNHINFKTKLSRSK